MPPYPIRKSSFSRRKLTAFWCLEESDTRLSVGRAQMHWFDAKDTVQFPSSVEGSIQPRSIWNRVHVYYWMFNTIQWIWPSSCSCSSTKNPDYSGNRRFTDEGTYIHKRSGWVLSWIFLSLMRIGIHSSHIRLTRRVCQSCPLVLFVIVLRIILHKWKNQPYWVKQMKCAILSLVCVRWSKLWSTIYFSVKKPNDHHLSWCRSTCT